MKLFPIFAAFVVVAVTGCSSNSDAVVTYGNVAGSYGGPVTGGPVNGYTFSEVLTVTMAQNSGSLSGTFASSGTLYLGNASNPFSGSGTLTGTINSGNNPSVNLTILVPGCPNYSAHFSGAYDSANHRLTITGPFDFFSTGCTVGLTFQETIIMNVQ